LLVLVASCSFLGSNHSLIDDQHLIATSDQQQATRHKKSPAIAAGDLYE